MKKIIYFLIGFLSVSSVRADIISDALELIETGQKEAAKELLQLAAKQNNPSANLYLGRLAFLDYDYPEAARYYGALKPAVKSTPTALDYIDDLRKAEQMISHIEAITVVDSIEVDSLNFFKNYRLAKSAGNILGNNDLKKLNPSASDGLIGFTNEFKEYMIWSKPDSAGIAELSESVKLIDGSWSKPSVIHFGKDYDSEDGENTSYNFNFPFMLDDGQTLYFASDNEDSLGGYDIFMASKDPSDGDFKEPINVGMPFNSPYNDLLMAIDRQNGLGWWATDRNGNPESITIYVYLMPDSRQNVDIENENLVSLARLSDFKITQTEEDIPAIAEALAFLKNNGRSSGQEPEYFSLPMGNGRYYTRFSDFKNQEARLLMAQYLEDTEALQADKEQLSKLRLQYFKGGKSKMIENEIKELEAGLEEMQDELRETLSEIYRIEIGK